MPMAIEMMTTKAPKSGSLSSNMPTSDHGAGHRQEGLFQIVHVRHLAHRVVGGVEHGEQFHQLRRLQVGEAERQPAARAIDVAADTGNQHQRSAARRRPRTATARSCCQADSGTWKATAGGDQADAQEDAMAHQVIGRLMAGEAPASAIAIDAE
jgi:hypothetical protein